MKFNSGFKELNKSFDAKIMTRLFSIFEAGLQAIVITRVY